jgi:hypothetical protein
MNIVCFFSLTVKRKKALKSGLLTGRFKMAIINVASGTPLAGPDKKKSEISLK